MSREAFLNELAEVLEVDPGVLQDDFVLSDAAWDSLAIVSTIALIDEHFGVTIAGEKLNNCDTVGSLLQLIDDAKGV